MKSIAIRSKFFVLPRGIVLAFLACTLIFSNVRAADEEVKKSAEGAVMVKPKMDIVEFYNKFNKDNVDLADEFYHPNVKFEDPVVQLQGLPALKDYYRNLYKNVKSIRFDFSTIVNDGSQQVAMWTMILQADGLKGGESISVKGNSHIIYQDGLAIYHRDYFDMGEFIYENIPGLGFVIRLVKARLHP